MNKILCSTGALLVYGGDYHLLEPSQHNCCMKAMNLCEQFEQTVISQKYRR